MKRNKVINDNFELVVHTMTSRRGFLRKSAVAIAGISTLGFHTTACKTTSIDVFRVIAYNVLKCTGWPVENVKDKAEMPSRFIQELAKYKPDLINFSESPEESVVKQIAKQMDMNYTFFPSAGNWPGAILSRFKIVDSVNVPIVSGSRPEDLFTRHWGKATIQLDNDQSVIVHSVHLFPHDNPTSGEIRKREISLIIKSIQEDVDNHAKSIIVMGDLNHTPEMPEYQQWLNAGMVDTFAKAGIGEGLTVLPDKPRKRIDFILAKGSIANQILESRALFEGAFRTDTSDPKSFALSDHLPQFAIFELVK
jgi:endonuclease/exonuclease/phosphatase family metal-dependent hydrolase